MTLVLLVPCSTVFQFQSTIGMIVLHAVLLKQKYTYVHTQNI